jgi:Mg-chelatase subunit ChlD
MRRIITNKLTQDKSKIQRKIKLVLACGETYMMDAIKTAYEEILMESRASPVMIITTDGWPIQTIEDRSFDTSDDILRYAASIKNNGTRIITVGLGEYPNEKFLKRLASSSEDYYLIKTSSDLKSVCKKISIKFAECGA